MAPTSSFKKVDQTWIPLEIRGCQMDDTGPQPFPKLSQFWKLDMPTGSISKMGLISFIEPVGASNSLIATMNYLRNYWFETPYYTYLKS